MGVTGGACGDARLKVKLLNRRVALKEMLKKKSFQ